MKQKTTIGNPIREAVVYIIWLITGMLVGTFIMFLGAALIFQTKRVPPEAAAMSIWPALLIATLLRLRKTDSSLDDINLSLRRSPFIKFVFGVLLGATFMIVAFTLLSFSNAITVQQQALSSSLIGDMIESCGLEK